LPACRGGRAHPFVDGNLRAGIVALNAGLATLADPLHPAQKKIRFPPARVSRFGDPVG